MSYSSKLKDPRWQKKRLEILNRDNFSCHNCGDTESTLHVHHIAYQGKDPWETEARLLQTLCEDCHESEELSLNEQTKRAIDHLKQCGVTSIGFAGIRKCFIKDRGWTDFEPAYDILAMAIDDDEIWDRLYEIYFQRLNERHELNQSKETSL